MKNGTVTGRICFTLAAGVYPLLLSAEGLNGLSTEAARIFAIVATGVFAWFAAAHWLDDAFAEAVAFLAKYFYGGTAMALAYMIAFDGDDRGMLMLTVAAVGIGVWMGAESPSRRMSDAAGGDVIAAMASLAAQIVLLWTLSEITVDPLALVQCAALALLVAAFAAARYGWPRVAATSASPV